LKGNAHQEKTINCYTEALLAQVLKKKTKSPRIRYT